TCPPAWPLRTPSPNRTLVLRRFRARGLAGSALARRGRVNGREQLVIVRRLEEKGERAGRERSFAREWIVPAAQKYHGGGRRNVAQARLHFEAAHHRHA